MPINVLSLDPSFWGSSTSGASAGAVESVDAAAASGAGAAGAGVAAAVDEDENADMVRSASETGVGTVSEQTHWDSKG